MRSALPSSKPAQRVTANRAAADRAALCTELVGIHVKHAAIFDRVEAIKSELKTIATDAGENFKETIPGKGTVNVAGAKEGTFKGILPILQSEAWLALSAAEKKALEKQGLVKNEEQWGSKYYGAVTVKLF